MQPQPQRPAFFNILLATFLATTLIGCATSPQNTVPTRITDLGETYDLYRSRPDFVLEQAFNESETALAHLAAAKRHATNNPAVVEQIEKSERRLKKGFDLFRTKIIEMQAFMQTGDGFFFYEIYSSHYETGYLVLDRQNRVRRKLLQVHDPNDRRDYHQLDPDRGWFFHDPNEHLWKPKSPDSSGSRQVDPTPSSP